jgi:hypothetical protein
LWSKIGATCVNGRSSSGTLAQWQDDHSSAHAGSDSVRVESEERFDECHLSHETRPLESTMKEHFVRLALSWITTFGCLGFASAQHCHRHPGIAQRHHDDQRQAAAGARSEVRRRHQAEGLAIDLWWAPRVVPPKKAPNVLLILTDDSGLRCSGYLRRGRSRRRRWTASRRPACATPNSIRLRCARPPARR